MEALPSCVICKSSNWQELASREYRLGQMRDVSEYVQKRYRVLFEIWFPDCESVTLSSAVCTHCGFVTCLPRPTERDIESKYRFISRLGQDYGGAESSETQDRRSRQLSSHIARSLRLKGRILDFGGGDGRLMKHLANRGHMCFLVDYNDSPREYVTKLADTIDGISSTEQFEAIVCNHVIEHVADPVAVLNQLRSHLSDGGLLYVEVPLEIWRRAPLQEEPVTHINFFVAGSLRRALEESHLTVHYCKHASYLHPTGRFLPAVRATASKRDDVQPAATGFSTVQRLLNPGAATRAKRWWQMRQNARQMILHKLKRR